MWIDRSLLCFFNRSFSPNTLCRKLNKWRYHVYVIALWSPRKSGWVECSPHLEFNELPFRVNHYAKIEWKLIIFSNMSKRIKLCHVPFFWVSIRQDEEDKKLNPFHFGAIYQELTILDTSPPKLHHSKIARVIWVHKIQCISWKENIFFSTGHRFHIFTYIFF